MQLNSANRAPRAIVLAGAILLIAASAALGTTFGYQFGSHYHWTLGLVFAGAALGGELLKPFAVHAAFEAFRRWHFGSAAGCLLVAFVCITYSLASELALSATSRGDLVAERKAETEAAGDAKADRQRYLAELSAIKAARPLPELEALVAATRPRCRIVVNSRRRETICSKDGRLLAEHGRAKRRAELEGKLAALESRAGTVIAAKAADPLASALVAYAGAAGIDLQADRVSTWLYLLPVIFLEIGSAFALLVAGTASGPATVPPIVSEFPQQQTIAGKAATVSTPARRQPLPRRLPCDGQLLLDALAGAGRPLSNRDLARAMGVTPGEATKRRRKVEHLVRVERAGRELRLSLAKRAA